MERTGLPETVLEELYRREEMVLCKDASFSRRSRGRIFNVGRAETQIRTIYQVDRDRILHSKAFRRLKGKTQVFLAPLDDHYRTRLTHTLEVSQIARTMARAMGFNEDLTEAIALGHDLGHTPFGHNGEEILNNVCPYGFKHYLQSVRVVHYIENGGKGLNLTREVLNGIACHTSGGDAGTPEGRLVRLADSIAYINHDIDDAIRAKMLCEKDLPQDLVYILGEGKSQRITTMVMSVLRNRENLDFEPGIRKAHDALKRFMFDNVYLNPYADSEKDKAMCLLEKLYKYYLRHSDCLPSTYQVIRKRFDLHRAVCDYIASMTDAFAIATYTSLFVPSSFVSRI